MKSHWFQLLAFFWLTPSPPPSLIFPPFLPLLTNSAVAKVPIDSHTLTTAPSFPRGCSNTSPKTLHLRWGQWFKITISPATHLKQQKKKTNKNPYCFTFHIRTLWYQMYVFCFLFSHIKHFTNSPDTNWFQQLNSDTNCPESAETPHVKRTVSEDCPPQPQTQS